MASYNFQKSQPEHPNDLDANIIDGAALVHFSCLYPHLVRQLEKCSQLDVVWDTYIQSSIKASTGERRDQGIRRKVVGKNKLPTNWQDFLHDEKKRGILPLFIN